MFVISKDFDWAASHVLEGLPADHPCSRLHGHNYLARVELTAACTDAVGFVVDYREMAPVKAYIDAELDHRHLNDAVPDIGNPTAERLAAHLTDTVRGLLVLPGGVSVAVGVSETPKTWAWYRP